jgi:hypothetical protein
MIGGEQRSGAGVEVIEVGDVTVAQSGDQNARRLDRDLAITASCRGR